MFLNKMLHFNSRIGRQARQAGSLSHSLLERCIPDSRGVWLFSRVQSVKLQRRR